METAAVLLPLSAGERADLARLETVIDRGQEAFRAVALALLEIRARRLYRAEYSSFDAYCRERWGFSGKNGYWLIQAGKLIKEREAAGLPLPTSGREARRMHAEARRAELARDAAPICPGPARQADDKRLVQERVAETRPGLAKTAAIEKHLAVLGELHASHPWRARADELLALYRQTVLPWPAEC